MPQGLGQPAPSGLAGPCRPSRGLVARPPGAGQIASLYVKWITILSAVSFMPSRQGDDGMRSPGANLLWRAFL